MVQGDLESTNANHVRSCPYMPTQKTLLQQDEVQSSIDGNERLASISDMNSTQTADDQSAKHQLEQVDENSILINKDNNKFVKIKSPSKEPIKSGRENRLRERNIDLEATSNFNQITDQFDYVQSTNELLSQTRNEQLENSLATSTNLSSTNLSSTTNLEANTSNKLDKTKFENNCNNKIKNDSNNQIRKHVYVNIDDQSSASTQLTQNTKSDYI